jgi:hypothetical protein
MTGTLVGPFAAAHESILVSDLDDGCVRLYLWLEMRCGGQEDWDRSVAQAAHELGWQARRALGHAEHLRDRRLITLSEPSLKASRRMRIRYQPARGDVDNTVNLRPPKPLAQPRRPTIREREHTRSSRMPNESDGESMSGWDGDEAYATVATVMRDVRVCPQTEAYATSAYAPVSALEEGYGLTRVTKEDGYAEPSSDFELSQDGELVDVREFDVDNLADEIAEYDTIDHGLDLLEEPDTGDPVDAAIRLLRDGFGEGVEEVVA